jgi:hypothetical protein
METVTGRHRCMALAICSSCMLRGLLDVIGFNATPLIMIIHLTFYMSLGGVLTHPETLTLPALSALSIYAMIDQLHFCWIRWWVGHPCWIIFSWITIAKRMLIAIMIIIMMFVV